jgi:NTE family protein
MSANPEVDMRDDLAPIHDPSHQPQPASLEGIGLCLSGGGFRAMLFHVGALWRLNELGYLPRLARVSSVSGGSITAGLLGLKWISLAFNGAGVATNFQELVVGPLRRFAEQMIDVWAVGLGALNPLSTISEEVQSVYRKHLFGNATLQDLPDDPPRFVINATNIQSANLFRFSKPYLADYRVGRVMSPQISLATAVAASSAFPPVLSPCVVELDAAQFAPPDPQRPEDLAEARFRSRVVLSDGGVYDNLGLESVWKRCETVLVSDAGQKIAAEAAPAEDWARHAVRVLDVMDNQVRSLRKRMLIEAYRQGRKGAYWGIRSEILDYNAINPLSCPSASTSRLAAIPTRLAAMESGLQERLINWGYAICDAAMRSRIVPGSSLAPRFPYAGGV